jgi:hypothetical protein
MDMLLFAFFTATLRLPCFSKKRLSKTPQTAQTGAGLPKLNKE